MNKMLTVVVLAIALSGCKAGDKSRGNGAAPEATADNMVDGPNVNVTEAAGIALDYDYRFRIAADRIAEVQEAHAQACEALGAAHCRIAGLHYQAGSDPNAVSGQLELLLDPILARKFSKDGIAAVARAGGKLAEAAITSADAGKAIRNIDDDSAHLNGNLTQLQRQLAALPPEAKEQATLQQKINDLQDQVSANAAQRRDNLASLATTPVTYHYEAAQGLLGVDSGGPFYNALELGLTSLNFALNAIVVVVTVAVPWIVLLLLARLLYLKIFRRIWGSDADHA